MIDNKLLLLIDTGFYLRKLDVTDYFLNFMLVKAFFRASFSSFTPSGHRFVCVHRRHDVIDELWKLFGGIVNDVLF